jgi:hypothetical protein
MDIETTLTYIKKNQSKFNEFGGFANVYNSISEQASSIVLARKDILLLPSWVIFGGGFFGPSVRIISTTQLVWAHIKKLNNYLILVVIPVPTGSNFSVLLYYHTDGQFRSKEISSNETGSTELMYALTTIAPWSFFGYDKDVEKAWNRMPNSLLLANEARLQALIQQTTSEDK